MAGKTKKNEAIRVNVSTETRERLEQEASNQERSIAWIIRKAIDAYLDKKGASK